MTHSHLHNHTPQAKIHLMKLSILILFFLFTIFNLSAETIVIKMPEVTVSSWLQQPGQLILYKFNSKEHRLQVIDAPNSNLKEAMIQFRCEAGVNGGFFEAGNHKNPMGLLIQDSTILSEIHTQGFWAAGIVYDTGHDIRLERKHKLSTTPRNMKQALQSGPFLVENGQIVKGLNNTKVDRRTFIATDNKGNWCIGICSPLSLQALAEWLAASPKELGFRIDSALNLDGGSSSGLYAPGLYISPLKSVRNYLGITKRAKLH